MEERGPLASNMKASPGEAFAVNLDVIQKVQPGSENEKTAFQPGTSVWKASRRRGGYLRFLAAGALLAGAWSLGSPAKDRLTTVVSGLALSGS